MGCQADRNTAELEFMNFQTPSEDGYDRPSNRPNLAAYISSHAPTSLRPLTAGMFGYSLSRPVANKDYFYDIFDKSTNFNCGLEAWHTESGPGVFEAVSDHTSPQKTSISPSAGY